HRAGPVSGPARYRFVGRRVPYAARRHEGRADVTQPDTGPLEQLLRYLWDNSATDLHLCAGTPPRVRIDGKLYAIPQSEPVSVEFLEHALRALMDDEDWATYQRERQLDFAFS